MRILSRRVALDKSKCEVPRTWHREPTFRIQLIGDSLERHACLSHLENPGSITAFDVSREMLIARI